MKYRRLTALVSVLLLSASLLAGCGQSAGKDADAVIGTWAYIHDPETPVLTLKKSGKAEYNGETYRYTADAKYINLKSGSEELHLRYTRDDDEFYLYQPTTYLAAGDQVADAGSYIGKWSDPETGWSFEFTEDGAFIEDGFFPGVYTADAETIKLMYEDHFYDTTIYYTVENGELHIEYPWSMVQSN